MVNRDEAVEYALKEARDNDVKFIRLWFADILGNLKGFAITVEELESTLTRGMGFDGSAIEGFARDEEIDLYALPDPNTFSILPWRPRENAVARMFCDIITPDEEPFEGDSRYVLRRNIERAANLGYTYYVGPELEYFYFKNSESPELLDQGGYFDQDATDTSTDLRRETVLMLENLGIPVEQSHHEVSPSQHEIDLRHTDAMTMADTVMTYRVAVKEVAQRHGCVATFMPKPITELNGSGMHTHQSLFKDGRNSFYDAEDPNRLSDNARYFIAGLLNHAREITAVTNQWVNSYKRLVPNFEAPIFVTWATVNRADLIRVPAFKPGREESRRIEYRAPDPCVQSLPLIQRDAGGGIGRHREENGASTSRRDQRFRSERRGTQGTKHRVASRKPLGGHIHHRGQRTRTQRSGRCGVRKLHPEQEDRVGAIQVPRDGLRNRAIPADPLANL